MMRTLGLEEEIIIKDITNLIRILKETKPIKDRIFRDTKSLFEYEEEDYYKPVIVNNFQNMLEIIFQKTSSIENYLNKIKPYLKDIINHLKKCDTWKIQLTITINFISSKDDKDEECEMHSKSDSVEIMVNNEADQVIEELF